VSGNIVDGIELEMTTLERESWSGTYSRKDGRN